MATKAKKKMTLALALLLLGACDQGPLGDDVLVDNGYEIGEPLEARNGDECTAADVSPSDPHCEARWCTQGPPALEPFPGASFACWFKQCDWDKKEGKASCSTTCTVGWGCTS